MLVYQTGKTHHDSYPVEIHDAVDVRIDGRIYDGIVTRLFPRTGWVEVRYWDDLDTTHSGKPRRKRARVPVQDIDLLPMDR